jgi:hypothetical protein
MRTKLFVFLMIAGILLSACGPAATTMAPATQVPATPVPPVPPTPETIIKEVVVTPTPGPNPEAVIPNVEANATITFWTFWLSPTFDQ